MKKLVAALVAFAAWVIWMGAEYPADDDFVGRIRGKGW